MSDSLLLLTKKLKDKGYSLTKPRLVTFETLSSSMQPLTMQDLIRRTSRQIDRASVYRTIDVFEESGVTHRIYSGWKYKLELSDIFQEHHHHFTCSNCGAISTIHNQTVENVVKELAKVQKFRLTSHQLELQGLCSKCY